MGTKRVEYTMLWKVLPYHIYDIILAPLKRQAGNKPLRKMMQCLKVTQIKQYAQLTKSSVPRVYTVTTK